MVATCRVIFQLIVNDKAALKFFVGVLFGLAFSISVILSTIGIMDGFEKTFRTALKKSTGDIQFYMRDGFFDLAGKVEEVLKNQGVVSFAQMLQSQGFVINEGVAKGVLIRGVDHESYQAVTGMDIVLQSGQVTLGSELAQRLKVNVGDDVVLALANGNQDISDLPLLTRFKVVKIIKHEIHQKDARYFYMRRVDLQELMQLKYSTNNVVLNIPADFRAQFRDETKAIVAFARVLRDELGSRVVVRPYWDEFSSLLEAVQTEKVMISIILQLIVIISIFNVLAFIIFVNESRSRELFLVKALGIGNNRLVVVWLLLVLPIWILACLLSILMVWIFGHLLANFSLFEMMADIYNLASLTLSIGIFDYMLVFVLALLWLLSIAWWGLRRLRKKSILEGLRKEFA